MDLMLLSWLCKSFSLKLISAKLSLKRMKFLLESLDDTQRSDDLI